MQLPRLSISIKKMGVRTNKKTWTQTLNNIVEIWENPCSPDYSVIVQTAFPAAGKALLFFITPSPIEITRRWLHPKLGRKTPRGGLRTQARNVVGRGGVVRRAFAGGLIDPAVWIASKIPGKAYFASRTPGYLERLVWAGIDRLEAVLFWFLVVATAEVFLYEWSSGIIESRFCNQQYELVYDSALNTGCQGVENNIHHACLVPFESESMMWLAQGLGSRTLEHFDATAAFTGTMLNTTNIAWTATIMINNQIVQQHTFAPFESWDWAWSGDVEDVIAILPEALGGGAGVWITKAHFMCFGDTL